MLSFWSLLTFTLYTESLHSYNNRHTNRYVRKPGNNYSGWALVRNVSGHNVQSSVNLKIIECAMKRNKIYGYMQMNVLSTDLCA